MKHQCMNALRLLLVGALAGIATGACTVGPDFKRPDVPAASGYSHSIPASGAASGLAYGGDVAEDWYQLFHSDALNGLVRQALIDNPDLEAARHGLVAAQFELMAASGSALPQIDAAGQIGRAHINGSFFYGPVDAISATGYRFALGPSLAYNLDPFGGVRRSIEAQRAATSDVRDQVLNTYVTLVDQVVITAFDYAATAAQIKVTRALIDELRSQYDLTQTLETAGKITRSDTLQAQTQLENVRATLPGLEQQLDTYRNALAQLSGKTPDEFRLPDLSLEDFTLPPEVPVSVPSILVRQRPDILAAEDNLHKANAAIGMAEAARLPSLSISAQYAQQTTKLNEFLTGPGGVWSVGADLTAPLFHGGTLAAREREAKAAVPAGPGNVPKYGDRSVRRSRECTASLAARQRELRRAQSGTRRSTREPGSGRRAVPGRQVHRAASADCRATVSRCRAHRGAGGRAAIHGYRNPVSCARRRLVECTTRPIAAASGRKYS